MIDLLMGIRFESVQSHVDVKVNVIFKKVFHHSIFLGVPVCSDITFFNTSTVVFTRKEIGHRF